MVTKMGLGTALLATLGMASCATIVGLDDDYRRGETGGGGNPAAGGGGTMSGGGGSGGCALAVAPDPPAVADDGGAIEFVAALRTIDLDEKDFAVTIGLDLDGVCTCDADTPPSCTPTVETVCDGPGGIDNAVGLIFAQVYDLSSHAITSGQISSAADSGFWTSLLRVRGYNGKPDDAKVEAMIYATQGVNAGMPTPKWNGTDAWPVDASSVADPADLDSALIASTDGYVANGVLVVHIPSERLRMRSPLFAMDLDLSDVVIRAKLEAAAGGYRLIDGVTAGKWPLPNAFPGLASIRYVGGNKLCTDDDDYDAVKTAICGNPDLRADGTTGVCDALSFGAKFTADPAQLGSVVASEGPPDDACGSSVDPTTDNCN